MKKFARTIHDHQSLIPNYFQAKKAYASATVEGINNKENWQSENPTDFGAIKSEKQRNINSWQFTLAGVPPRISLRRRFFLRKIT